MASYTVTLAGGTPATSGEKTTSGSTADTATIAGTGTAYRAGGAVHHQVRVCWHNGRRFRFSAFRSDRLHRRLRQRLDGGPVTIFNEGAR